MLLIDTLLGDIFEYIIAFIEACGALIILIGVVRAAYGYFRCCIGRHGHQSVSRVRLSLGQSMVVALEFQIAADILKTGFSPTWRDILLLGAVIGLRTLLNVLLEHELAVLRPECEVSLNPMASVPWGNRDASAEGRGE
jgi:uncharacterized membrane protein